MAFAPSYAGLGGVDGLAAVAPMPGALDVLGCRPDPERRHDLEDPDHDQPDPDNESQYDDGIERPREHDDAGDDAHDPDEDRPPAPGNARFTDRCSVVATPWKMNPTAIHMASNRT